MSECIHEYRLEFGEMVCDHCGYGQRHIELEVARQRIATQEAEIKALREQLAEAKDIAAVTQADMARLVDARIADGFEKQELREQLARMPMCVGYVADYALHYLTVEKRVDGFSALVMPDSDVNFSHPIYIDPAPQEKQG